MRIAHIVDSMDVGGAETLVLQMCRLQRLRGHDPSVYAVATLGDLGRQMQDEDFSVHAHVGRNLVDANRNFFRIFRELRPDVVHIHNPTPTIFAAAAARMAGVPSIVSARHSLVAPPRKWRMEVQYAAASRFCDWVVGICDATVANLASIHSAPPRKIVRVYNGTAALTRTAKEGLPSKSGFTFVFVGRLEAVKNHQLLLRAFSKALPSMPSLRLWMVGDGNERMALEKLAESLGITSQVTFWGQQLDVAPYFSAADAFIMSSKSEGLPMSLLQAFSLGLPAIVTDVGGMAEVVRLAKAGIAVPLGDPAAMAAAMQFLANNDTDRRRFSMNAQTAHRSGFTLETMVDAYMGLYRETPRARLATKV